MKTSIYKDKVYGKIRISEPLILELIKTSAIQRLKKIDQRGYLKPHFSGAFHSRFEHSLGVFYLLKKYGVPFKEQVAGLIHDVSHAAFSHCIDYVLNFESAKEQNHQDNIFQSFIKKTEIPQILKKHGLNVNYILNDRNFPMKERVLPDLCADRIDYSLRTAIAYREIKRKDVSYFLNNLIIFNNYWVFKNLASAKKYSKLFLKLNFLYYSGLPTAIMFSTVGDCLRYSLKRGYLTRDDLYTTDEEVLKKIKKNLKKDKKLKLLFDRMDSKVKFENNPSDYEVHLVCKSRIVDPLCRYKGKIKRFSDINKNWLKTVKKESIPKEYFIKFER